MIIDVQQYILKAMKKEIFPGEINDAARKVLADLKTKQKDVFEKITESIQYKILKKMLAERQEAKQIYLSNNRFDLANIEKDQEQVIKNLMEELEEFLPKSLTALEIRTIIEKVIKDDQDVNMRKIMKAFKSYENVDRSEVAKIAKEYL